MAPSVPITCDLSIVVPVLNEEDTIDLFIAAIAPIIEKLGLSYEIIFVDDGSTDATVAVVEQAVAANSHARLTGPLLAAYQSMAQMRPGDDSTVYAPQTEVAQHLEVMAAAGFDTIVACSDSAMTPPPAGFATLGSGKGWAIYAPRS